VFRAIDAECVAAPQQASRRMAAIPVPGGANIPVVRQF
jgi:hypothetical protein